MKTGLTLSGLRVEMDRISRERQNRIVPVKDIAYADGFLYAGEDSTPYSLTDHSAKQLSAYLDIPQKAFLKYFRDPDIKPYWNDIVTTELGRRTSREPRMLRLLDGKVQAFVSDSFAVGLDAHRTFPTLISAMNANNMDIESSSVTDTFTYVKAVSPQLAYEVLGQTVQFGLSIQTSDVGAGRHKANGLTFTLACFNGMVISNIVFTMSHTHRGKKLFAVENDDSYEADLSDRQIQASVEQMSEGMVAMLSDKNMDSIVKQINEIGSIPVNRDLELLGREARSFGIQRSEWQHIEENLKWSGRYDLWGLSSAVTRYAQEVGSYDRSTELEEIGWKILDSSRADRAGLVVTNEGV